MKSSTKMASAILLIVAVCLYTISGIEPQFKKSKVYDDPNILITDYIDKLEDLGGMLFYSYEQKDRGSIMKAKISKLCETISKRNRLLAFSSSEEYLNMNEITPMGLNNIFNDFFNGHVNENERKTNIIDINKVEKIDYTQSLEQFIDEYNESYNKISKYNLPETFEVYKVNAENSTKRQEYESGQSQWHTSTYIIYFIVVDEGEGLVIDCARSFNTSES